MFLSFRCLKYLIVSILLRNTATFSQKEPHKYEISKLQNHCLYEKLQDVHYSYENINQKFLPWILFESGDSSLSSLGGDLLRLISGLELLSSLSRSDLSSSRSFSSESELLLNCEFELELEGDRGKEEFLWVSACCFMLPCKKSVKNETKIVWKELN